jgi:predicted enzyme related to lactoylglutathione lyase
MLARDGYLPGVPCWVDVIQPDVDGTMAFYGGLFGWTFQMRTPDGAPLRYAYAVLDGLVVGGVGGPPAAAGTEGWTQYVWVDSAADTVAAVEANGGRVLQPPTDIPHAGRSAVCADPAGAVFGLWEPAENRGAQLVNAPGSWNFSELHTADPDGAERFYGRVLGWESSHLEMGPAQKVSMWRVPRYGSFLAQRDPEIYERQESASAPDGFADAVALMDAAPVDPSGEAGAHWSLIFAVADADAAVDRAVELGAKLVTPLFDTDYTRMGTICDPQGAILTLSQYRPPEPG